MSKNLFPDAELKLMEKINEIKEKVIEAENRKAN